MQLVSEDLIRAEIAERHRRARETRFAYGVLMSARSRRKAEEASLRSERALADRPTRPAAALGR